MALPHTGSVRAQGYVGVVGPEAATPQQVEQVEQAVEVGRLLARHGLGIEDTEKAVVLGVDRQAGAWVGAVLPRGGRGPVRLVSASDLATLVARARSLGPVALVGVDIPVGLPDTGVRQADVLVRRRLGPRASSVFATPVRDALAAPTYAEAREVSIARTGGRSLSAQSYALRAAILDVDGYVRRQDVDAADHDAADHDAHVPRSRVVEVHPELCFAVMAGAPLSTRKTTSEGIRERLGLLLAQGIHLPADVQLDRRGVDDVLDAAAVAWTAARVVEGRAQRLPARPERFADGLDAAMWV